MQLFTWIKDNLLASKLDVFLTLVGAYFIYYIFSLFFTFVFTSDWTLIEVNRKILLVGLSTFEAASRGKCGRAPCNIKLPRRADRTATAVFFSGARLFT